MAGSSGSCQEIANRALTSADNPQIGSQAASPGSSGCVRFTDASDVWFCRLARILDERITDRLCIEDHLDPLGTTDQPSQRFLMGS